MFLGPGTPRTHRAHFDGFIHIRYAAPPYSARTSAIYLLPFGSLVLFCLLTSMCNAWQRSRTQNLQKVLENSGPILSVCGPKFMKFLDIIMRDPLCFSAPLPACLCHVSFRSYSPLSVEVLEKSEQM